MRVDQRTEDAFLRYVLDLAREMAAARVRQDESATTKDSPEGANKKG
jgi:hypothetical protein